MSDDDRLRAHGPPTVMVTADGPYLVEGEVKVRRAGGTVARSGGPCFLCRCGGSRAMPLCDLTHGLKAFDGTETAEPGEGSAPVGAASTAQVTAVVDGPLEVIGVEIIGADGVAYSQRNARLCRCGRSATKPFCDDSHLAVGFRDPIPAELVPTPPTLYERAGGVAGLEALTNRFYEDLLAEPDPILEPVFRGMDAGHAGHVAAWLAETFGGPASYTLEHGGYHHMVHQHAGRALTEEQRRRWIDRLLSTADLVGMPADPDFRSAFVAYLEWGTRIAVFNSAPGVDLIEHGPVPRWGWGESTPYLALPWE